MTNDDLDRLEALCEQAAYDGNGPLCYATPTERGLLVAFPTLLAEVRRLHVQNLNFRAAIEQIMPRYVEMFTYAGLGDPSESVAVQLARDVMAQP